MFGDSTDSSLSTVFKYFGFAVFSYYSLNILIKIFKNLYAFTLGNVNFKKYGNWAVVTGCTDGIGKAYAEKLAKKGLNIVLISRSIDKLNDLSKNLISKYKVDTKVIASDFTDENSIYENIKNQIQDLEIAVLINNVGIGSKYPEYLAETPDFNKTVDDMIHCNITAVTKMSAIVLPGMVKRKGGIIVNNSSASGRIPTPLLTLYSATKAYVDFFSRALNVEYSSKGIIVQSLCPYFVSTKLSKSRKSFTSPDPNQFVSSALKTIGLQDVTNGCMVHNIQGWLLESLLSPSLSSQLSYKSLLGVRKSALRKINAAKKE